MTQPATILLIEGQRRDIELTLDAFREARFANNIRVATSGEEALDCLFGRKDFSDRETHPLPDLILLDLKMPGIDGFEILKQIKQAEQLKRIPVVMLATSTEEGERAISYDLGTGSYLVKPVSFDGFLRTVQGIGEFWVVLNVKPQD